MSDVAQLQAIKTQTLALLLQLRAQPKPTYQVDGQSVRWEEYVAGLERTVNWCDEKLAAELPYEEHTRIIS